ncbi:hypothetical protein VM1G_11824 [Cytospora mali]|uniref:Uncharacterized protein n=1 Tax=Cytospora mali TaxID=578113 RepID=A0A194W8F1_CYTMA|nr:hypothetical protein VM1G_11824 [Valsa mali]
MSDQVEWTFCLRGTKDKCDGEGQKDQCHAADEDSRGSTGIGQLQSVTGDLEAAEYGKIAPAEPCETVEAVQEQNDHRREEE